MFAWLTCRSNRSKAGELYGAVVTIARTPGFYSDFLVPDTTRGRFEMVILVLYLVLERAKSVSGGVELTQATIEAFVTDMDDCMRELGVGDLTVPKKVKRAATAFYERAKDYHGALAGEGSLPLARALSRHVWDLNVDDENVDDEGVRGQALAKVVRRQVTALERLDDAVLENASALVGVMQNVLSEAAAH